jgi:hypothetical protein
VAVQQKPDYDQRLLGVGDEALWIWCRQREHQVEVWHGQQLGVALGEPFLGGGALALGAVPIAPPPAWWFHNADMTPLALLENALRAALFDRKQMAECGTPEALRRPLERRPALSRSGRKDFGQRR